MCIRDRVNQGRFREDLYFRLSVVTVRVPSLRERPEDIELLVNVFLDALDAHRSAHLFTPQLMAELGKHPWPGNVRELRNFVERTIVLQTADGPVPRQSSTSEPNSGGEANRSDMRPIDLNLSFREAKDRVLADFELAYLTSLLEWAGGNVSRAARKAKMDRMNLHRLVQRYGLREGRGLRD